MDSKLIYAKTAIGDEAVRQSTRVVQRNLRMVLVQVDGKLSVEELSTKIGDPRLVMNALRELQDGGFITPSEGVATDRLAAGRTSGQERVSALSQFSTFGPRPTQPEPEVPESGTSSFSSFGKPILPTSVSGDSLFGKPSKGRVTDSVERESVPQRSPGSLLRWVFRGAIGLFVVLITLILLYPYKDLKPEIESGASRLLSAPVRIGEVGMAFLPRPILVLSNVSIGGAGDSTIEQVRIHSPLSLLGTGQHVLSSIEVLGASILADRFLAMPLFQNAGATAQTNIAVRHISIERMTVIARDLALRDLSGEIRFKNNGGVEKAVLNGVEHNLHIVAVPVADGGIHLDIDGLGWKTQGSAVTFNALQAKGVLQKGRLLLQDIDTTILGGVLKGSWLLDWSNGLVMAGDASLMRLDCKKVGKIFAPSLNLEGELGGALRLRSSGRDWESLWLNVEAVLDADISRGLLHGLDLGEVVRRGGQSVRGGSTKFDNLKAVLTINSRQVSGRDLRMSAGMVSASGQFVAGRERPVDASLVVTMKTSVSVMRTSVRVSGELSELVASGSK